MYGILPEYDLSFLQGKTLIQVCFGPSDLQLHFAEENVCITVESIVELVSSNGDVLRLESGESQSSDYILNNASPILALLMDVVQGVDWSPDGTLNMHFSGTKRLSIFDNSEQFESYTIRHGADLFVI